jgi:hypothetical protein
VDGVVGQVRPESHPLEQSDDTEAVIASYQQPETWRAGR